MNILGIIPARGGSKGFPRKNLALLKGRPLLSYTCEAALRSRTLTGVILSTDDPEMERVGRECGVDVPFIRPADLAKDDTAMVDVIQHAVLWIRENRRETPDILVVLQPTSPLRRAEHIDGAVELLSAKDADTVVSVIEVPHQFSPVSLMSISEGRLVPASSGTSIFRRQDKPKIYARNGPAVLATRRETVEAGSLYGATILPLEMSRADSIDIDSAEDMALAEFWMDRR